MSALHNALRERERERERARESIQNFEIIHLKRSNVFVSLHASRIHSFRGPRSSGLGENDGPHGISTHSCALTSHVCTDQLLRRP